MSTSGKLQWKLDAKRRKQISLWDRGATLRLGERGRHITDSILGEHRTPFLTNSFYFKNIGRGGTCLPAPLLRGPCLFDWLLFCRKLIIKYVRCIEENCKFAFRHFHKTRLILLFLIELNNVTVHLSYFNYMSTKLYNKWFNKASKALKNVQACVSFRFLLNKSN